MEQVHSYCSKLMLHDTYYTYTLLYTYIYYFHLFPVFLDFWILCQLFQVRNSAKKPALLHWNWILRYLPAENRLFSGDLIYPGP